MTGPGGVAGKISAAVLDGVAAVRGSDAEAFGEALGRLAAADPPRVALVLGGVVRSLLEELHPDGMDGEDVRAVLVRCVRGAAGWGAEVDPEVLLMVLTGALGLSDPEQEAVVTPAAVSRNALLLTADLLGPRPPEPYLRASFAELQRAETIEMP